MIFPQYANDIKSYLNKLIQIHQIRLIFQVSSLSSSGHKELHLVVKSCNACVDFLGRELCLGL